MAKDCSRPETPLKRKCMLSVLLHNALCNAIYAKVLLIVFCNTRDDSQASVAADASVPPEEAEGMLGQVGSALLLISPFFFWGTSMVVMKVGFLYTWAWQGHLYPEWSCIKYKIAAVLLHVQTTLPHTAWGFRPDGHRDWDPAASRIRCTSWYL